MAKIKITNPQQIINGGAKKYYFKVKGLGGPKGDKGDKGDTGSQGPQGPQGNAATVSVGSTTTLPVGQDATVENVGSLYNAVLNFGIPQGPRGPQGATGAKGDKGDKGDQGNTGPTGPAGQNATVYIGTTTTLNPGTQATVYNSGTENNAVLNFGIPRGEKGETGATGATGATGPAGQDGQNFTPTIVDSLPATGNQSNLYLTPKNYTTGTATGNPITISLGEDAGQVTSAQLDGDTTQQAYSGAQMLKKQGMATPSSDTNYWVSFTNLTQTPGSNGWAKLEKTNTNNFANFNTSTSSANITGGQTYTAIVEVKNSTFASGQMVFAQTGQTQDPVSSYTIVQGCDFTNESSMGVYLASVSSPNVYTFVAKSSFTRGLRYYIQTATTGSVEVRATLLAGDHSSDWQDYCGDNWQPYVGGTASPNPDYPQAVNTVTGLQTVEIQGKNIFNYTTLAEGTYNGVTASYDSQNQAIVLNGTCTTNNTAIPFNITPFSVSGNQTISYEVVSGTISNATTDTRAILFQAGYASSINVQLAQTDGYSSFTRSGEYTIARIRADNGVKFENYKIRIQLELSAAASSFAPYSHQTLPIDLGKNLFDVNNANVMDRYYFDGSVTSSEIAYLPSSARNLLVWIACKPSTTYSITVGSKTNISQIQVGEAKTKPAEGVTVSSLGSVGSSLKLENITTSNQAHYLVIRMQTPSTYVAMDYYDSVFGTAQIEIGSTATTFTPYKTPIELCKIGTYQDYIYKDDGEWKIHKATAKITLDSSSFGGWSSTTAADGYFRGVTEKIGFPSNACFCNCLSPRTGSHGSYEYIWTQPTDIGALYIQILATRLSAATLAGFNEWINSINPILYYTLTTATDTTITDQTLIAQLEAVRNATLQSSNTITNTATGTNLAGDLELGYYEYDPHNRYNKWLWLDINNNYEQLGS